MTYHPTPQPHCAEKQEGKTMTTPDRSALIEAMAQEFYRTIGGE